MLKDVIAVHPKQEYGLELRFEDGVTGVVDLSEILSFTGVFEPLSDSSYFALARVDPDLGTVCWPNGADLDPDVLYSLVTGEPIALLEQVALNG